MTERETQYGDGDGAECRVVPRCSRSRKSC